MKKIFNTIIGLGALAALFLTSCGSAPPSSDSGLKVLASTSFLADIAQNVAGDRLKVESLLPIGSDPHAYQPTPSDAAKIADSNVLILNGLEYEHFIESLIENAGGERLVIEATEGIEPHELDEHAEDEDHADEAESGESDGHEAGDPHMWLNPILVITYVENIRDGLIEADPEGAETYKANADAYIAQLQELDKWIVEQVDTIPAERRLLVTNHEAMGYFAERYGFEIVDTILVSFSSGASASAQEVAETIEAIRSSGAPAIFLGEVENASLANQIAAETGVKVVDDLHFESLTDGEPAATYIDMMKYNTLLIVEALK
ncbi:MAG TPA: zinc ABC transporter substrate-binding protein [Anaerolineales bacterium]|nr:zinc ABC transporter substrate-binding protein [Anaerolineales bacterium]